MKKLYTGLMALALCSLSTAQISEVQNFNGGLGQWEQTGGGFTTTTLACEGSSYRDNIWSNGPTGELISPVYTDSDGTTINVSFDYKTINYSSPNGAAPSDFGSLAPQYRVDGGDWQDIDVITTSTEECTAVNYTVDGVSSGSTFQFRVLSTWVSGDWYAYVDNVVISQVDLNTDADEDGYSILEDCDDSDPNINPGATEIPDNDVDENCDGIILISAPDNDACSDATSIAIGSSMSGDATGATNNDGAVSCSSGSANDGVWYTFVGNGAELEVVLENDSWDGEIQVFSGSCDTLECVGSADSSGAAGNESFRFESAAGTTYLVNLGHYSASDNDEGAYTIALNEFIPAEAPANDACGDAASIEIGVTMTGDASAATNNDGSISCSSGTANDGVWYTFVGNGSELEVVLTNDSWDGEIQVFSGSCDTLECVGSADSSGAAGDESYTFESVAGTTYLVNLGHYSGTDNTEGPYTITVNEATPPADAPANDACDDAASIEIGATMTGDASTATNNDGNVSCISSSANDGVWYTFVGNGSELEVVLENDGWDGEIQVFSGSCDTLECVGSVDAAATNSNETYSFNSVQGTTYLVNLGHYSANDNSEGPYTITINELAAEECAQPTGLTASDVTQDSANLSWTAGDQEATWQVIVVEAGAEPSTGTVQSTNQNMLMVNGLMQNQAYDYYVRSVCGEEFASEWSMGTFTTLAVVVPMCDAPAIGDVTSITTTSAIVNWTGANDEDANFYVNYALYGQEPNAENAVSAYDLNAYTLTNLEPNTAYTAYVYLDCGEGLVSDMSSADFTTAEEVVVICADPVNLMSTDVTISSAELSWTYPVNTTNTFQVVVVSENEEMEDVTPVNVQGTSYSATALESGTSYTYYVRAVCDAEAGLVSEYISNTFQTVEVVECVDPTNLSISNITQTSAEFMWVSAGDETEWEVFVNETGTAFDDTQAEEVSTTSYTATNLEPGTSYTFYVRGICGENLVSGLLAGNFTTDATPDPIDGCPEPTNVTVDSTTATTVTISYDTPEGTYIDIKAGTAAIQVANPRDNRLEFRDVTDNPLIARGLTPGTQYFFRIRTDCGANNVDVSEWSETVYTATTLNNDDRFAAQRQQSTLYPNPAVSSVSVNGFEAATINIFDANGVMVRSFNQSENQFDVTGLSAGQYRVHLIDAEGNTVSNSLLVR